MSNITKKMFDSMLKCKDFCIVVSEKLEESGLKKGDSVFIAGTQLVPVDSEDLYNQRVKMLVAPLGEGEHVDTTKIYLVDPHSLKRVSKLKAKKLTKILTSDFSKKEVKTSEGKPL